MMFENTTHSWEEKLGYIAGYAIFTTALFYTLIFLKKLPEAWTYAHIAGITLVITAAGTLIKRKLR
jgi:uncharacterized membrane protein YkgB